MAYEEVTEGKGTILLIDDEEMIIKVGKMTLPELGYTALYAGSGIEAIEVYMPIRLTHKYLIKTSITH